MGSIMASQNIMALDYQSNISLSTTEYVIAIRVKVSVMAED